MKNHQLILLTTVLFITLFYDENLGLNLGILALSYSLLIFFKTPIINRNRSFLILFLTSILSGFAFAWYGDFISFLAIFTSISLFTLKSRTPDLKTLLVLPVVFLNAFTFFYRFFQFDQWLPKRNTAGSLQKIISVLLIPGFFIIVFFGIYSFGSDHFSNIFSDLKFEFDFWQFLGISILGFFIAFNIWNFKIYTFIFTQNKLLKNDFLKEDKIQKSTYSFLDLDAERSSGIVSLVALNILLVVFIITFNYEQFIEIPKTPNQLSTETHERVNAVILSIIMAILVIMFYFKGSFNFDKKTKSLKVLAKIWIFLNVLLVISAVAKNSEYIVNLGLTYKRLGVYAFLILSIIGLMITFYKIHRQKTNAFLFNQIIWYFYGIILVCSFVNWGGIITQHNLERKDFNINYDSYRIDFNEKQLLEYAEKSKNEGLRKEIFQRIQLNRENPFLSKTLYYETLKTK